MFGKRSLIFLLNFPPLCPATNQAYYEKNDLVTITHHLQPVKIDFSERRERITLYFAF